MWYKSTKEDLMKKLFLTVLVMCAFSTNVQAADQNVKKIVDQLIKLDGAVGKIISTVEENHTDVCKVSVDVAAEAVTVRFEDTGLYFTPVAHIFNDARVIAVNTVLVSTDSNRPGGDACGIAGGSFRYKKTVAVSERKVVIEESFRCALEGFKKYVLTATCQL